MKPSWPRPRRTLLADPVTHLDRSLLISIQPRFANAILDGSKTIELRRTMPTLAPGATALIYCSSPTKALVGWATVQEIVKATPSSLWRQHSRSTGVTSAEFKDYFDGRADAYGLRLTGVESATNQVSLSALRSYGIEPPQSWRYVDAALSHTLRQDMCDGCAVPADLALHVTG